MPFEIVRAKTGFCFGVKRAIDMISRAAAERGQVETLAPIVHNQQVMDRLAGLGVRVAASLDDVRGSSVAIGSHGVAPDIEAEMRRRFADVIDTTCHSVHRAQLAARHFAEDGLYVIVYGEADHPEVRGILGYAGNKGVATLDVASLTNLPKQLGVLSQTTQIPERFNRFAAALIDSALTKGAEIRFIDTICHDIPDRQQSAIEVARKVDLMLVVGSHTSANTNHLVDLCATATRTLLVETADQIDPAALKGVRRIGITAGASTAPETIEEVVKRLESMQT